MKIGYLWKEIKYYKNLGKGHVKRMGIKFILAKTPLSKMVNTSIYNKIYKKRIKKQMFKLKPSVLQIETTNFCNAKCIMCPHIHMKRKQISMSKKDFIKICKNILPYTKIKLIALSGFGEPLIDSNLTDKIKWINKNYPYIKIDFYTNASLLTPKLTNELLKLKIHKINFSINGTEKSYQKIMKLNYEETKKNILYFLERRKEGRKKFPLVNISLMVLKENEREIGKIINFWKDKSDSVMAYLPSDWAGNLKISGVKKEIFKKKRWPCRSLWNNILIDVEGNFVLCCRDYDSKVKFGNLFKNNIKELLDSEKYRRILKKHRKLDFSSPVCSSCDNSFDSSLEWWT